MHRIRLARESRLLVNERILNMLSRFPTAELEQNNVENSLERLVQKIRRNFETGEARYSS